jgi:hypothetical protein
MGVNLIRLVQNADRQRPAVGRGMNMGLHKIRRISWLAEEEALGHPKKDSATWSYYPRSKSVHLVQQMFVFSGSTLLLSKQLRSLGKFHVAYLPKDCFVSGDKKKERNEERVWHLLWHDKAVSMTTAVHDPQRHSPCNNLPTLQLAFSKLIQRSRRFRRFGATVAPPGRNNRKKKGNSIITENRRKRSATEGQWM